MEDSKAIAIKLKLNLLTNFYSILDDSAPPTCWVNKQDKTGNKQVNYINEIKEGVLNRSIPSAVADSGATSNVATTKDRARKAFVATGKKLDKAFRMPNGEVKEASNMDKLHHNVRHPAKGMHIVPGIKRDSLLSIPKFVNANYIVIFDRDEVNIYDANIITIVVSRAQSYKDGNAIKQTYGPSPSSNKSRTTTQTQSSVTNALRDSYPTDHHQVRPSTMFMS